MFRGLRLLQRSDSCVKPRTFELFQMLGMLDDMKKHATPIPPFRGYKLPGGREVTKEWTLYPKREVWPDRPHVSSPIRTFHGYTCIDPGYERVMARAYRRRHWKTSCVLTSRNTGCP